MLRQIISSANTIIVFLSNKVYAVLHKRQFFDINILMKHIIQFHVYKGDTQYVAEGVDIPVITQGKTLDELAHNIQEAVELQLEGENLADFNLAPEPSILANFELAISSHA